MRPRSGDGPGGGRYRALCQRLSLPGTDRAPGRESCGDGKGARRLKELQADIDLAGLRLGAYEVLRAARRASTIALGCGLGAAAIIFLVLGAALMAPVLMAAVASPYLVRELIMAYPASLARKHATEVLRSSSAATNLMIMSLRLEPSVSKSMMFASRRDTVFSRELRRCVWEVVMGRHASFEEALHDLGARWSRYSGELKTSMNALVTASREGTEEGKRRALDRANSAMVQGARRRIEEFALSLSTPSMIMFGLGILLPLMVGSFLPMLSWSAWGADNGLSEAPAGDAGSTLVQTVFLMNVLFPSIALVVALNAMSRHPMDPVGGRPHSRDDASAARVLPVLACSAALCAAAVLLLDGEARYVAVLVASVTPFSLWLVRSGARALARTPADGLEDALFRAGGRMVEGENLESSLWRVARDTPGPSGSAVRRLSFRPDHGLGTDDDAGPDEADGGNALEALRIVRDAAGKDERAAGVLAMDLAAYLRDLQDLESSLTARVKPTISMMKTTAHVLAPVVLGVTYAIYLALGSISGDGAAMEPGFFFLVLGAFLMETNASVVYFVWGIEGRKDRGRLMRSMGTCLLTSMAVYSASAVIAS